MTGGDVPSWQQVLPDGVHVVTEAIEAGSDDMNGLSAPELALITGWSRRRRAEFAAGRRCAHRALQRVGVPSWPLLRGAGGEPMWSARIVGSICHTDDFATAAVAEQTACLALGIDAEPDRPLPVGVLDLIAGPQEWEWVEQMRSSRPEVNWGTLLFSAKESVLKAWYPCHGTRLQFSDMNVWTERRGGPLVVELRSPLVIGDRECHTLRVPWTSSDGVLRTAVAVEAVRG